MAMRLWKRKRSGSFTEQERAALKALVAQPLFELIPLSSAAEKAESLPPGAAVTVTASVSHGIESTIDLCEAVVARGHEAVPHLSAHMIRDRAHLTELLARIEAAGIRRIFVVGGDARDRGDFHDGLGLLRAIDELGHRFDEIGIPAYPEGHVDIPDDVLMPAMREKQRYATSMTTQMSFNPKAITEWVRRMRAERMTLPVVLGVPGVADLTKLMRVATRIGVADSARYLRKNRKLLGHLIKGSFGPDQLLEDLAPMIADPAADVRGLHIFTFNQVEATVAWQRTMLDELGG
jgi:methylenetetrahydrofolate reductase (NADPH)